MSTEINRIHVQRCSEKIGEILASKLCQKVITDIFQIKLTGKINEDGRHEASIIGHYPEETIECDMDNFRSALIDIRQMVINQQEPIGFRPIINKFKKSDEISGKARISIIKENIETVLNGKYGCDIMGIKNLDEAFRLVMYGGLFHSNNEETIREYESKIISGWDGPMCIILMKIPDLIYALYDFKQALDEYLETGDISEWEEI